MSERWLGGVKSVSWRSEKTVIFYVSLTMIKKKEILVRLYSQEMIGKPGTVSHHSIKM